MKIAVASNDGRSISRHFGRSQCFIVFDVDGQNIGESTIRPNQDTAHARGECDDEHEHTHRHEHNHSHDGIVAALQDCDAVLCYGMGQRAAVDLDKNNIRPFLLEEEVTPEQAVRRFLAGDLKQGAGFCRHH